MAMPNTNEHIHEAEGVWLVGFAANHAEGAQLMSGLVDILDVQVDTQHGAVIFVVKSLDKTGCLFKTGVLKARKVGSWNASPQPLLVDGTSNADMRPPRPTAS